MLGWPDDFPGNLIIECVLAIVFSSPIAEYWAHRSFLSSLRVSVEQRSGLFNRIEDSPGNIASQLPQDAVAARQLKDQQ